MIDIVERLRVFIRFEHPKNYETHIVWQAADEIERLRAALREIAKTDVQTWAKAALEKRDWAIVERISEVDQQGIACRALAEVGARAALGEKE